ncbi:hypothetical protein D3C86_1462140 [compost metagenome]
MPVLTVEAAIEPIVVVDDQPGGAIGLDVLNLLGVAGRVLYLDPLDAEQVITAVLFDDDRLFGQFLLLVLVEPFGALFCFAFDHRLVELTFRKQIELFGNIGAGFGKGSERIVQLAFEVIELVVPILVRGGIVQFEIGIPRFVLERDRWQSPARQLAIPLIQQAGMSGDEVTDLLAHLVQRGKAGASAHGDARATYCGAELAQKRVIHGLHEKRIIRRFQGHLGQVEREMHGVKADPVQLSTCVSERFFEA